jgi:hypothetical protein
MLTLRLIGIVAQLQHIVLLQTAAKTDVQTVVVYHQEHQLEEPNQVQLLSP